jgi:hypothetical protein
MVKNATSQLTWYHKPFGRRVAGPDHPCFFSFETAGAEDRDARRRRDLADVAGL